MKIVPIKPSEAFPLTPSEERSFKGRPVPCRISGPPDLVRLVEQGGKTAGAFWFEKPVFTRLRDKARLDLMQQNPGVKEPFAIPMKQMVGLYMKHCLRSDLAICKNWTQNFDNYAVLTLSPADSLVAWVGKIADQPYYEKPTPVNLTDAEYQAKLKIYVQAEVAGISLLARESQYVIRFDHPANQASVNKIIGPLPF